MKGKTVPFNVGVSTCRELLHAVLVHLWSDESCTVRNGKIVHSVSAIEEHVFFLLKSSALGSAHDSQKRCFL